MESSTTGTSVTYAMLHNSATFWDFSYTDGSFPVGQLSR